MRSVRLDDQGRVIAVATGPPRRDWHLAPDVRDPWRLMRAADGEWLEMSARGAAFRDHDHTPKQRPLPAPRRRLDALRGKKPGDLSQEQLARAVLDLIDTL